MEIILIFLAGILMGAFNFGFFMLGYFMRGKTSEKEGVTVTKENQGFISELMEWRNYGGTK